MHWRSWERSSNRRKTKTLEGKILTWNSGAQRLFGYTAEEGQEVQVVHSAEAALERARAELPDVLISDIAMPGMDGYELAQRVRQEPEFREWCW